MSAPTPQCSPVPTAMVLNRPDAVLTVKVFRLQDSAIFHVPAQTIEEFHGPRPRGHDQHVDGIVAARSHVSLLLVPDFPILLEKRCDCMLHCCDVKVWGTEDVVQSMDAASQFNLRLEIDGRRVLYLVSSACVCAGRLGAGILEVGSGGCWRLGCGS